jgi:hypothetical protein
MVSQALPLETQVMPGFRVGHHFFYNAESRSQKPEARIIRLKPFRFSFLLNSDSWILDSVL